MDGARGLGRCAVFDSGTLTVIGHYIHTIAVHVSKIKLPCMITVTGTNLNRLQSIFKSRLTILESHKPKSTSLRLMIVYTE